MFHDLPILGNAGIFVAAAAIVWAAGTRLAGYADAIAIRTGVGHEFVGILLLGGITSLPEIAVATTASLQGTPLLSVNDVIGSAAINLLILAVADAAAGPGALTALQASPLVMLQGVLGIIMLALAVAPTVAGDRLFAGIGGWCWLMLLVYLGSVRLLAHSQAKRAWNAGRRAGGEPEGADVGDDGGSLGRLAGKTAAAGAAILAAGFLLARAGDALAAQSGLGASFFGAVFLGFATSLPEVSTVVAAVRLKRYEMAISDILGTNLFNVLVIFIVDALYAGDSVLVEAGRFAAFAALLALAMTALFLVGLIERRDRTILRMGFDSLAVLLVYGAGLTVLHGLE